MRALFRWATLLAVMALLSSPWGCSRRPPAEPPPGTKSPAAAPALSSGPARAQDRDLAPSGDLAASGDLAPSRRSEEKPPAAEGGGAEIGPSREILLRRQDSPPAASAASGAPATPLEQEEQTLLALPAAPVLPEDFRIGELADLVQSDNPARGVASVARNFLDALVRGEVDATLIEPGRREELNRSLAYYLSGGDRPEAYRLGAVEIAAEDPDEAWLNLRLFGSPGRTEGELYLRRVSQRWYVLDLQAELTSLRQPYSRAEDRFYPSIYAWGLE